MELKICLGWQNQIPVPRLFLGAVSSPLARGGDRSLEVWALQNEGLQNARRTEAATVKNNDLGVQIQVLLPCLNFKDKI